MAHLSLQYNIILYMNMIERIISYIIIIYKIHKIYKIHTIHKIYIII